MKIGFFHSTLPEEGRKVGGVEVFVDRLAASLARAGHDVEVVTLTKSPRDRPYRHRQILNKRAAWLQNRFSFLFVLPILLNWVDFGDYDILHFHGSDWFFLVRRVPTMRTLYGSALWEARAAISWKRKLSQYLVYPLEHLSKRLANVSTAIGDEAAALYRTDGISKLFASKEFFSPGVKTACPSFLFVGTWLGRKRGAFVADMFEREIAPQFPGAKLYMACDYVPKSDIIVHLRNPDTDVLAKILREAWLLLSASTYEGFGLPYLEALMSGTCVVTTRNSGAEYVLKNGECGMIVEDAGFANAVRRIVDDRILRRQYEQRGLSRAEDFSEETVVAEHLRYYRLAQRRFMGLSGEEVSGVEAVK